jgi:hypothetical protein
MACQIVDLVAKFDPGNIPQPIPYVSVFAEPSVIPVFILSSSIFREPFMGRRVASTDVNGQFTFLLPWPSEQDPALANWIITLPDGSRWMGLVPQGVSGPLTIHDLKIHYGWGLIDNNGVIPVAIEGDPGLNWVGTWSSSVPYEANDAVSFLDPTGGGIPLISSFRCLIANLNVPPITGGVLSPDWAYIAQHGGSPVPDFSSSPDQFLRVNDAATALNWVTLTADMIAAAFIPTLSGPASPVEVGSTVVNPAFTASYNRPAAAATLNDGTGAIGLTSPFTAFAYGSGTLPPRSYTRTGINAVVTWTLTANETGGPSKTSSASVQWEARAYWDTAVDPGIGGYTAAFITSLTGNALEPGFARTIAFGAGGGTKKMYYAFPTSFGTPARFLNIDTGFAIPFSKVGSAVSVTSTFGVTINYDLWGSDFAVVGAVNAGVS